MSTPFFLITSRLSCTALLRSVLLAVPLIFCQPLAAQSPIGLVSKQVQGNGKPAAESPAGAISVDELKQRLAVAQAELAAIDSPERMATGAPPGTPVQELKSRLRIMRLMVFAYRQHLNALESAAPQKKLADDAEAKRRAWPGLAGKPPYSILLVDSMRAELQAALLDLRSEEARSKVMAARSDNAKENLIKANEHSRLAQETLESAKLNDVAGATWRRDLAALDVRAQGASLESLAAGARLIEANVAEYGRVVDFIRRKISDAEASVIFRPEDLERLKAEIDERRSATIKALDDAAQKRERLAAEVDKASSAFAEAETRAAQLQQQLAQARKAMSSTEAAVTKAEKPDGFLQKINPLRGRAEKAELEKQRKIAGELEQQLSAAQAAVQVRERAQLLATERSRSAVQAVEVLNTTLITLAMQRDFWDLRYSAVDKQDASKLDRRKMFEGSRRLLMVLNPAIDYLRTKLEVVIGQIIEQQGLLRQAGDAAEIAYRKELLELLMERERNYLTTFSGIEETRHLLMRWVEDEAVQARNLGAADQVQGWVGVTGGWLKSLWTFELFVVDDSIVVDGRTITGSRGVTVAKVVKAILIVVIGYLLVAVLTRLFMAVATRRGRIDETSARIARKWIMAVVLVMLLLLALDVVNIPLTAFAFLGGAIAIGAGFGMQTLLKNLISGVMLLMERPFKPRDIVEVGGIRGEVTDINVRSCTIRDVNGIETLVPNSTFLEQNVTNWTLSNRKVRFTLNIGVGYGSPVRRVSDLLLEVAEKHQEVLHDPEPSVLFMDFGDNALMFSLYIWLEIGPGRRAGNIILSDLRFMIDASFAEHGIEIPFPQRNVHLDASAPLPVRIMPAEIATGAAPPAIDGLPKQ